MSAQGTIAKCRLSKSFQKDISLLRAATSCLLGRPTLSVLFSTKNGESRTSQDQGRTHLLRFLVDPSLLSLTCLTFLYCRLCLIFPRAKTLLSLLGGEKVFTRDCSQETTGRGTCWAASVLSHKLSLHFKPLVPPLSGVECPHFPSIRRILSQNGMAVLWPLY